MFDGLIFLQEMVKSLYIIILSLCYFMIVDAKPPVVVTGPSAQPVAKIMTQIGLNTYGYFFVLKCLPLFILH